MARAPVPSYATALVLQTLDSGHHYGFDIMDATGLPSGTVYPILRRLDHDGLVGSEWERVRVARQEQRPPRRYYDITRAGLAALDAARAHYRALTHGEAASARRSKPVLGTT